MRSFTLTAFSASGVIGSLANHEVTPERGLAASLMIALTFYWAQPKGTP